MNKSFIKGVLFTLLVVYVISPADFAPGPIDDVIAILIYYAANRKNFGFQLPNKDEEVKNIEVIDTNGKEM